MQSMLYIWVGLTMCVSINSFFLPTNHHFHTRLAEPCDQCQAPYGFHNHMPLNENTQNFSVSCVHWYWTFLCWVFWLQSCRLLEGSFQQSLPWLSTLPLMLRWTQSDNTLLKPIMPKVGSTSDLRFYNIILSVTFPPLLITCKHTWSQVLFW